MMTIILSLAAMLVLAFIIAKACDGFETATDYLGRNMSEGVKGATLNAVGSSMPEFLTTVFFLVFATTQGLGNNLAASIGGDTGSAIFNSIIIPIMVIGTVIFALKLKGAHVSRKVILRDGLFLIGGEILLLVLLSSSVITHWHGWVFTIFYLIYMAYTLLSMKKSDEPEEDEEDDDEDQNVYERFVFKSNENRTGRAWAILLVMITVLAAACAGLVHAAEVLSEELQINMLFVSLVLVACASSVPDAIISMKDAKKGNYDDALSNVLGSNIFDITISMGLPLAIFLMVTNQSINFSAAGETLIDIRVMLLIITAITIGVFYFSKMLGKGTMVILSLLYIVFVLYAVGAAGYHAEADNALATTVGHFIEFLHQHLSEPLRTLADSLTGSWTK